MIEINTIRNENCLETVKMIPDNFVDFVLTDPPYEIEAHGGGGNMKRQLNTTKHLEFISNGFDFKILDECCRILKKINFAVFCSNKQVSKLMSYFENYEKTKLSVTLCIWHKTNPIPFGNGKFLSNVEFIVVAREKGVPFNQNGMVGKVFTYPSPATADRIHVTQKPVKLIGDLISLLSNENDLIYDPFIGSGTTAKACIQLNRNYIGSEIEKDFVEKANHWLKPFTHQNKLF